MSWRTVPLNWMRELSYRGVFHAEELNFLHVAFEEGGFIAGGFARVFAHAQLFTRRTPPAGASPTRILRTELVFL